MIFEARPAKVDKERHRTFGQCRKVTDEARLIVFGHQVEARFVFDDDGSLDEMIRAVAAHDRPIVQCDGDVRLILKVEASLFELDRHRIVIDPLAMPRPKLVVDLHGEADDFVGEFEPRRVLYDGFGLGHVSPFNATDAFGITDKRMQLATSAYPFISVASNSAGAAKAHIICFVGEAAEGGSQ